MRQEFIHGCETEDEARKRAPWAVDVIDCDGGFMAFESELGARVFREEYKLKISGKRPTDFPPATAPDSGTEH
jgi:hypothetical protein